MDTKHLSYFKVENFKRFDSLEVNDIGQFNLIVGDNNVGKTSLLESLLFDEDYTQFLRNFDTTLANHHFEQINSEFTIINLLSRLPKFPINYSYQYGESNTKQSLNVNQRLRSSLTDEEIDGLTTKLKLYLEPNIVEFSLNNKKDFKFFGEMNMDGSAYYPFVPFTKIYGDDIKDLFSKLAISNKWLENFKTILKDYIPNLSAIEVSNAYTPNTMIMIRESDKDISQPLSQYGDAVIKLFRYLLEIDLCQNKRLMIDEIDAGVHYSRMKEFLKKVLRNAKNKGVQIFATTHSKECIQYYTEALQELGFEQEGRIIKIADTKSGIKTYTYNFEQFENSLYAYSEIR